MSFDRSAALIAENANYVAGGVNSNFRTGMAGGPLVFQRGEGPYLIDADDNRLIDYYCGMGAMILGHSPKGVQQAVKEQVENGILYAGQSEIEFEAAKILCEHIPSAQRHALRLIGLGSGAGRLPPGARRHGQAHHPEIRRPLSRLVRQYPVVHRAGRECGRAGRCAGAGGGQQRPGPMRCRGPGCDRLERSGAAGSAAGQGRCRGRDHGARHVQPGRDYARAGYLEGALAACRKHGAILIFDEVITGFRLGRSGAQARFGVTPDLSIFAKAIANGFPVAAIVGRADLLDMFATGGVLHGGTFNAQPVTMAAMVATQKALTPEQYEAASKRGVRLRDGIAKILKEAGIKAQVTGFELMFHVGFGLDAPARNYRDLLKSDKALYVKFAHALLKRGVRALERGAWFVSFAHDDAVIDATLEAVRGAAQRNMPSAF